MVADIVERLRQSTGFKAHHTDDGPVITADMELLRETADEIVRLRATIGRLETERIARDAVRAEMARRGLLRTQLLPYFDDDTQKIVVPTHAKMTLTQVWEFLAWLDKETERAGGPS